MTHRGQPLVWAVLVAAVMFPVAAQGQFWLGGGPSFPLGELADEAKRGYHYRASWDVGLSSLPVRLRTDFLYQRFNNVYREPNIDVSIGGDWYRQLGFNVNAMYEMQVGSLRPYGLLGGSWLREWHDDRTFKGTKHRTLSATAGVGLNIPVPGGITLFVEAPYLGMFGKPLHTTPPAVLDEVKFRSIPTTIGIRL